jgi:hypothetical protein
MIHGNVVLATTLTAALAAAEASLADGADQVASGPLYEVAVPSTTMQFDALHQSKVREYFANHNAALVPAVPADSASVKVGGTVPESVHLFPLPDVIFTDVPTTPVYLYFHWGNAIVVADVDTRVVVSIITGIS